jgi:uracil-xanthine permease
MSVLDSDVAPVSRETPGVIYPEDRLPFVANVLAGVQHVLAMFGGTVLGSLLMGFDPNLGVFFSGVATLIFYVAVQGRIPSYLGSSFSFIAPVLAATGYAAGSGHNPNIAVALGGIAAAGLVYFIVGVIVAAAGYRWLERLMPPVVTGAIVAVIGLNLAPVAVRDVSGSPFDTAVGMITALIVALGALLLPVRFRPFSVLIGCGVAYFGYYGWGNVFGLGAPIDFSELRGAAWFGAPHFTYPHFTAKAVALIAPVAIVLIAENLGHVRAISGMMKRNLDPVLGRAFMADGFATMMSASFGSTGVTTYAENIGVMSITRNFSSLTMVAAGLFAILLGLSPKFGEAVHTIPTPVVGGLTVVLFGLIAANAGRIWRAGNVDFSDTRNLLVIGVAMVMGAGDMTWRFGNVVFGGIATATFSALVLYHIIPSSARSAGEIP